MNVLIPYTVTYESNDPWSRPNGTATHRTA